MITITHISNKFNEPDHTSIVRKPFEVVVALLTADGFRSIRKDSEAQFAEIKHEVRGALGWETRTIIVKGL